ncbi:PAS/PAC sensor hybrid histidine kinase [Rhodothalassium salexigens DSM 2132]|uniref:histidine kinase n=1 Tax=Rhodothalassium salexigens DSM 2132 TaxID=1188247 RepID=A0A4V2SQB5_RHOSA|nr:PAS domain S-box protein [Rhodothalassium salexigens]MBB4210051.1 PAS domain S-box-containing protein [Rhodothalassium salexigens DSM 2132]MBK1637579.1 hypothetical protein [Rhodothalassium salexigens DSM 2132]TCP38216.1 PAS/PAC sensor hybrid histidine kinase [Rhodothalassium salexigens DSM 2132]
MTDDRDRPIQPPRQTRVGRWRHLSLWAVCTATIFATFALDLVGPPAYAANGFPYLLAVLAVPRGRPRPLPVPLWVAALVLALLWGGAVWHGDGNLAIDRIVASALVIAAAWYRWPTQARREAAPMDAAATDELSDMPVRLLTRAVEATDTGIMITDPRLPDNPIIYANPALSRITGYPADEMIGRNPRFLQADLGDQAALDDVRSAVRAGRTADVRVENRRKDGRVFINALQISPVRDVSGTLTHFIGIQRDVTDQVETERKLRDETDLNAAILETVEALILLIDAAGRIVHANRACERLTGYRLDALRGRRVADLLLPPDEAATMAAAFHPDAQGGYVQRFQSVWLTRDGLRIRLAWSVSPMHGADAVDNYYVFSGLDITQRWAQEADSEQARKMEAIGELTSGIAHDFNNLLTVIQGNLEFLSERLDLDARLARRVADAREAADLGGKLTRNLLAFGRRQSLRPELVNLNTLVATLSDFLSRTLGEAITVETVLSAVPPWTKADPAQVRNALINLAINARDAMPDGGTLTVSTSVEPSNDDGGQDPGTGQDMGQGKGQGPDQGQSQGAGRGPGRTGAARPSSTPGLVRLRVSDTGVGMTPEIKARAFEPFFTTKREGAGTGLGLSSIYGFARQSGGYVRIASTPGVGTSVDILLPRHDRLPTADDDRAALGPQGGSERVLLVEDDDRVRRITSAQLEDLGFAVCEAANAAEALERLADPPQPDVLVTDVVMPGGMGGVALANKARAMLPTLGVLLISGYAPPDLSPAADTGGESPTAEAANPLARPFPILLKPFSRADLDAAVRDVLQTVRPGGRSAGPGH